MRLNPAFVTAITAPVRLWSRVWLAVKFRVALNYSWRLAWYMARRPS